MHGLCYLFLGFEMIAIDFNGLSLHDFVTLRKEAEQKEGSVVEKPG